jgi:hypothetical protein
MKRKKVLRLAIFLMIAAFVLAACGSGETPPPEVVDALTNVELDQPADTADDAGDDLADDAARSEDEDQPDMDSDEAAEPISLPPEPKAGLEATDPSTVMLASGSPQLVEFFAYW